MSKKLHKQFSSTLLRRTREELGLSRPDLILLLLEYGLRVSEPTLSNWESGATSPGADDLALLSLVLKKPVGYFFAQELDLTSQGQREAHG